ALGLTPADRMALCHHAFRAAEDHSGRDLLAILAGNVAAVVKRHAHRWDEAEPAPSPSAS
ncbi:MAG TPA: hypothetical protein VF625_13975, partial [Longimicrobium sp.]